MAYEIAAAIIQGVCTIFAGGIAGSIAAKGIDSWRREAPGRRRVELAEQCLVKAFETKRAISSFEFKLARFVENDLSEQPGQGYRLTSYIKNREEREAALSTEQRSIEKMLAELNNLTELTALYFGDELSSRAYRVESYFNKLTLLLMRYHGLCDTNHEPTPAKQEILKILLPDTDTPEYDELIKRRSESIRGYQEILGPHLNIAERE